jgi:hypothetical protein
MEVQDHSVYLTVKDLKGASTGKEKELYRNAFNAGKDLVLQYWEEGVSLEQARINVESISSMLIDAGLTGKKSLSNNFKKKSIS